MLTEDEAKTKWCPHSRVLLVDEINGKRRSVMPTVSGFNRTGVQGADLDETHGRCIGSACMAWRWGMPAAHDCDEKPEFGYRERGYCGLAGKP